MSLFVEDWRLWLLIDYVGVKLLPLAVALWLIRGRKMQVAELGLTPQGLPSLLAVFLVVALAGTVIDQNGYSLIARLPGYVPPSDQPAQP